jgi:hypothetical protein
MELAFFLIFFILLSVFASLAVAVQRKRRSGGVVGIGPHK